MNKIAEQVYQRSRISLLVLLIMVFMVVLILRLFQKQIIQHGYYQAQAESQHVVKQTIPAQRGKVYFQDLYEKQNYPIATNNTLYQVMVVPNQVNDIIALANHLAPMIGKTASELVNEIQASGPYYMPPVAKKLSHDDAEKIKNIAKDNNLEGVYVFPEYWRDHPEGYMAAHLLGFVDAEGVGRYGVEGFYNTELAGQEGRLFTESDIMGRPITVGERNMLAPEDGKDVTLTIDHTVQFMAEQKLKATVEKQGAESGALIVMDPKTGDILAMASYPTYDPGNYEKETNYDIFNNPVVAKAYEPGSVFKIVTMAAALDSGKIQPETEGNFGASVTIGDHTIWNSIKSAYGKETMTQALENSDNIALVWVSNLLGRNLFYKYINDFGFGVPTGIDLDGEASGEVKKMNEALEIDLATMAFGQGIAVTPIQMLAAAGAIANGGKLVQPHVMAEIGNDDNKISHKTKIVRQVISPSAAEKITQMMISVVERGHGKAAAVKGYRVAGKTGTAQIPLSTGGYDKYANIGSFAGFAPAEDPKFVMLVKIDKPKNVAWAEESAAPLFGDMAKFLLDYYQVAPGS